MATRMGAFMATSCKVSVMYAYPCILPVFHCPAKRVRLRHSFASAGTTMNKNRPKHLALYKISLPLPGLVSFLHRVSGALLFLALPMLLWVLQYSLFSIET